MSPTSVEKVDSRTANNRLRMVAAAFFVALVGFGFYTLLKNLDPANLAASMDKVDFPLAFALVSLNIINILLAGMRFGVLVSSVAPEVDNYSIANINIISMASAYAHIGKLNAPVKALLLNRLNGVPLSRVFPVVAVEAFYDLAALALIALAGTLLAGPIAISLFKEAGISEQVIAEGMLYAVMATLVMLLVAWLLKGKVPVIARIRDSFRRVSSNHANLALAGTYTAVLHAINVSTIVVILHFLELEIDFPLVLLLTALPVVVGLFTPLPGGLGVREYVFSATYALCCGSASDAVVAALLLRLAFFAALPIAYLGLKLIERTRQR